MKPKTVRLAQPALRKLETALGLDAIPQTLQTAIEGHLTDYARTIRFDARTRKKWYADKVALITTARQLLTLLATSPEETAEASRAGADLSPLQSLLAERLARWEMVSPRKPKQGPITDWARSLLAWRTLHAFDAAGVKMSSYREGPGCMLGVRAVLFLADRFAGRRIAGHGNMKLARKVWQHYAARHSWSPTSTLRLRYESDFLYVRE